MLDALQLHLHVVVSSSDSWELNSDPPGEGHAFSQVPSPQPVVITSF